MHEVGSGLEQAHALPLLRAPFQERALPARKIGLEIKKSLPIAVASEVDPHAFGWALHIRRIKDDAVHPGEKYVKDGQCPTEIDPAQIGPHVLGDEVMRLENGVHR